VADPWLFRMRWLDLLFAHWPIPVEVLAAKLPAGLELDTWDGTAWLGIVPFTMADVAPRGIPAIPRLSRFPELNVRTCVRRRGRSGVWFLSLDAASRPTVAGARLAFDLPYFRAAMHSERIAGRVAYRSERTDPRGAAAAFHARYAPTGSVVHGAPGSFEDWLTRRMRLFAARPDGRIRRLEIDHPDWPLQPAEAEIEVNTMAEAHGIALPARPPHLLYAGRLDVHAWAPRSD
jgi:uncharacterized protein